MFRALSSRYGISRQEARKRLAYLERDTKLSLRNYITMVKKADRSSLCRSTTEPQGKDGAGTILQLHKPRILTEASLGHQATEPGPSSGSKNGIPADTTQS